LKEPVYSQKEAESAAGMGNYILKAPNTSIMDAIIKETKSDDTTDILKKLSLT